MATIEITAEQALIVARLATARQALKDAQAAEKAAKEQIEKIAPNVGDVLTIAGLPVLRVEEGSRTDLDKDVLIRRAPAAYRLAQKKSTFRKVAVLTK